MRSEEQRSPTARIVLYRSMKADGEYPQLGRSHTCLGVIVEGPRREIEVGADGYVDPGSSGMSVTPNDPTGLPIWRLSKAFGGTGTYDLWQISSHELPRGLRYQPDIKRPDKHGTICPTHRMPLDEFESLLASTRLNWERVLTLPPEETK